MEFQNNNGAATHKEAGTEITNKPATNGAAKTNGMDKANSDNGKGDAKEAKPASAKGEAPKGEAQSKPAEPAAEAEPATVEAKPVKGELTLDAKLKAVADLHRRSVQRLTLIARIKLLEDFQIKLSEDGDELENNPYQGCRLIIEDDKRNQFVTSTPNLIKMVSEFIFNACVEKLEEIESTINFPTAP